MAGASHSFAITTDGALFSWGAGQCGRLGHGDEESQKAPLRVAGLQAHARTHTRAEHTHAHTHTRTRAHTHTHTRTHTRTRAHTCTQCIPYHAGLQAVKIRAVSGGAFHSLAADEHGGLHGWGDGDGASLGLNLTQDQLLPTRYDAGLRVALE